MWAIEANPRWALAPTMPTRILLGVSLAMVKMSLSFAKDNGPGPGNPQAASPS
jgi:hypothetical protein